MYSSDSSFFGQQGLANQLHPPIGSSLDPLPIEEGFSVTPLPDTGIHPVPLPSFSLPQLIPVLRYGLEQNTVEGIDPVAGTTIHATSAQGTTLSDIVTTVGAVESWLNIFPEIPQPPTTSILPSTAKSPTETVGVFASKEPRGVETVRTESESSLEQTRRAPSLKRKQGNDQIHMSCEQCPGRHFLGKKELDRHKREKHDKTTLFYCPDINCKRHREGFPRKSNCDRHIKLQHRNITLRALDSTVDSSENPTSPAQSNENWSSNVPEANPLDLGGEAVNDSETGFGERAKRPRIEDVTYLRAENSKLRERNAQLEKELQGLRYKYEERGNIVRMLSGRDVSRF